MDSTVGISKEGNEGEAHLALLEDDEVTYLLLFLLFFSLLFFLLPLSYINGHLG